MEGLVCDGMELDVVENREIALTLDCKVNKVAVGSVGKEFEVSGLKCEVHILDTIAIKIAGNAPIFAQILDI